MRANSNLFIALTREPAVPKISHKYKIGETVKIREDLILGKQYGEVIAVEPLYKLRGTIATIISMPHNGYYLSNNWGWSEEMLEPATTPCGMGY